MLIFAVISRYHDERMAEIYRKEGDATWNVPSLCKFKFD